MLASPALPQIQHQDVHIRVKPVTESPLGPSDDAQILGKPHFLSQVPGTNSRRLVQSLTYTAFKEL